MRADQVRMHPVAQRAFNQHRVDDLKKKFDHNALGVLGGVEYPIPGEPPGPLCVDGHNRVELLKQTGRGHWMIEMVVYLDIKDEAGACNLFLWLNYRLLVATYESFRIALKAGWPAPVGVAKILEAYGMHVSPTGHRGGLCCVSELQRLWNKDDGDTLELTIHVCTKAWGHKVSLEGKLIEGIGNVIHRHGDKMTLPVLIKKLGKFPGGPAGLLGASKGLHAMKRKSVGRCVQEVVAGTYNVGRSEETSIPID